MVSGNAIIGQSGGPTAVINASLAGVVEGAKQSSSIRRVFGMRFGIEGVLGDHLLDLTSEPDETLAALRTTPSSALGSTRLKLKDEHLPKVLETLARYDIRYFFMIGGNDSMNTIMRVVDYANAQGYQLFGVGVCKTVDNDLYGTDHTPGYPSAARYVALSVLQAGLLARDMQKVDQYVVFQTVGRSAGWLPAAASLARTRDGDAPHIILLPERKFDRERFLAKVKATHAKYGFVSIVAGEGITDANGNPVSASQTKDLHGNVEFGAMGGSSVAMELHKMIKDEFGWRGEFQVVESLQMCAADRSTKVDQQSAFDAGREAVRLANAGTTGVMVTIKHEHKKGDDFRCSFGTIPLVEVANADEHKERTLLPEYITEDGMDVTEAFADYLRPLVGPLPEYARLKLDRAKP
jgi:6-phosphofructokinase 1